jgi:hypothetical protein
MSPPDSDCSRLAAHSSLSLGSKFCGAHQACSTSEEFVDVLVCCEEAGCGNEREA